MRNAKMERNWGQWLGARSFVFAAALALGATLPMQRAAADEVLEYGQYLSSQCATCHRLDAFEGGIPPLGHLPKDYFVIAMKEYKSGRRSNPAMVSVANSLSEEEIEALAAYYAAASQNQ